MQGAAHHNVYGQLDAPELSGMHYNPALTPEGRALGKGDYVDWHEVRKKMVRDLTPAPCGLSPPVGLTPCGA